MRFLDSCIAIAAVFTVASAATAQTAQLDVDTTASVIDMSQTPNTSNMSDDQSSTGTATNNFIFALTDNPLGNGVAIAKASAKAGVMKVYADTAYNYVIRTGTAGGYAGSGASINFTDYFTVNSSTLPIGTLTTLNFSYAINGSVNVPEADQARPGISAFADGYIRAQTKEDDQEATFYYPQNPLGNFGITVQAAVGETFSLRYGLEAGTYLQSDIPDYRFVDSDFYNTAHIYANTNDPNISFTTASGYNYANLVVVPEPTTLLLLIPGLTFLICIFYGCVSPGLFKNCPVRKEETK